jgi:DNA-binding LacI/PurR family transcriptional regulator
MPVNLTIEDIARAAGVSVSTVSRIINDKPDVAVATRTRVQQIIDELGYRPHSQAQSLAAGKSRTIALLFPSNHTGFTQLELDFFIGAAEAAAERGYFFNLMTGPMADTDLLKLYRSANFEGTILMQICLHDARVESLRAHHYPFVMIGRCQDNTGLSYIDLDFEAGIQMAFDYLHDLGHQRIGFIAAPQALLAQGYGPAVRSLWGYERVLAAYGWSPLVREAERGLDDMYAATVDLLKEQPDLTAVVTMYGGSVSAIIRAAQDSGRCVPDDFSVIAIASTRLSELMMPRLTAIDFPTGEVGYRAAQLLLDKLQGVRLQSEQIVLAPQLVVRESTGPAPAM